MEAGAPEGVLNVVNGDKEAVDALIEDPRVKRSRSLGRPTSRITFTRTAARAANACRPSAAPRTTWSILPDADMDNVVNQLIGSAYGSAGERCMATPVAVPVGEGTAKDLGRHAAPRVQACASALRCRRIRTSGRS